MARVDMLWFLGAIGALLLARRARSTGSAFVALAWLLAAVVSIAINGHRDLPNYFVQAAPALALAASAGFATLGTYRASVRYAVAALLLAGLWRVGSDAPVWGMRFASLPGLVENIRYDLQYARGRIDRDTYLSRFRGQKYDALEIDRLARYVRATTDPVDPVFVFGFSGGSICWKSERRSSSRFFWSRPILIEFAADRPGYGSAGLLRDLQRAPPAVVALQKEEWRSRDFFMNNSSLRTWLEAGYTLDEFNRSKIRYRGRRTARSRATAGRRKAGSGKSVATKKLARRNRCAVRRSAAKYTPAPLMPNRKMRSSGVVCSRM